MDTLWRWSTLSSVFLLLINNVGQHVCQNEGQLTLQRESIYGCNPRLSIPNQEIKDLVISPQNCIVPGGPSLESLGNCYENFPINQFPYIAQDLQSAAGRSGLDYPESVSVSPPKAIQNQCPRPPTPCLSQQSVGMELLSQLQVPSPPFQQGVFSDPGSLTGPPLIACANLGIDTLSLSPQICPPLDSSPFPNGVQCLDSQITVLEQTANARQCRQPDSCGPNSPQCFGNQINSLAPPANARTPDFCGNVFCPQELHFPSPCSPCSPSMPLNDPGFSACLPPVASQGPTLTASQLSCLPQDPPIHSQCNCLHETSCFLPSISEFSSADCPSQIPLPLSPFNMFRFPKPTLFPSAPLLGPLASPCDPVCASPSINTQNLGCVPGCDSRDLIREELLFPQQVTVAQCPLLNAPLGSPYQNNQPCNLPPPVCPPVIPFCSSDQPSTNWIPQPNIVRPCLNSQNILRPQISNCAPIGPLMNLPMPLNLPICDIPCPSSTPNIVPTPINFKINVPPPNIPPPKITIINLTPQPAAHVTTAADEPNLVKDIPVGMPPIIIEGRKSRSRSWLPLLLVSLFAGDGGFGFC